jgi:hypothetical protein
MSNCQERCCVCPTHKVAYEDKNCYQCEECPCCGMSPCYEVGGQQKYPAHRLGVPVVMFDEKKKDNTK